MECCKCTEHRWDDPQEVVWEDEQGQGYCIFHAPKECPLKLIADNFNELILNKIAQSINEKTICDLSGVIFSRPIDFSDFKDSIALPEILFTRATFCFNASFYTTQFSSDVSFYSAVFCQESNFDEALFKGEVNFTRAKFIGEAYFFNCMFEKEASFYNTYFKNGSYFYATQFKEITSFENAIFEYKSFFDDSKFLSFVTFYRAQFNDTISFNTATFHSNAIFSETKFLMKCHFEYVSSFKAMNFCDCLFLDTALFSHSNYYTISFNHCIFLRKFDFSLSSVQDVAHFTNIDAFATVLLAATNFHKSIYLTNSYFYILNMSNSYLYNSSDLTNVTVYRLVSFHRTAFLSNAWLVNFTTFGDSIFYQATFSKYVQFDHSSFTGIANFINAYFNDGAFFNSVTFLHSSLFTGCLAKSPIILDYVNMISLPMTQVNIEFFRFRGCKWPKIHKRRVICEETKQLFITEPRDLEATYRRLKRVALEEKDFVLASDWHYNEKYWKMKQIWFPLAWTKLYFFFSGFGERPGRSILWLLAFLIWPLALLTALQRGWFGNPLPMDSMLANWLNFIPFVKAAKFEPTSYGRATWIIPLMALSQILISVQAALFGLALRNRLRR